MFRTAYLKDTQQEKRLEGYGLHRGENAEEEN